MEENLTFSPQFAKRGGLLPCIAQEDSTGEILMVGSVNEEALKKSLETRKATFFSTSRQKLWTKGETSGEFLQIRQILTDCDQDAIIYKVEITGSGACHTKDGKGQPRKSCFYREINLDSGNLEFLAGRK